MQANRLAVQGQRRRPRPEARPRHPNPDGPTLGVLREHGVASVPCEYIDVLPEPRVDTKRDRRGL